MIAVAGYGARRAGTLRDEDVDITRASIHAEALGCGGLIHVAVGLAGGVGVLLTKRARFSANARSSVTWRAA